MRCKNCGWPNKPGEQNCVKCHAPLTSSEEVAVPPVPGIENAGAACQQTVREEDVFGPGKGPQQPPASVPGEQETLCPRCGYPLRSGAEKCPNCNYQLSGQPASQHQRTRLADGPAAPPRQPTRRIGGGKFGGTVNPYMQNVASTPSFVLKPVKRIDERHELEELEYEGEEVTLNRDNTEPGNPSITSRRQAVLTHTDGHWYIEDTSDQKTTFVQASRKTELHEGDIILLGNRLFEFHE